MMTNIIIILIVLAIIGSIVFYLVKEKKKGARCIGCPYAKECSKHCLQLTKPKSVKKTSSDYKLR